MVMLMTTSSGLLCEYNVSASKLKFSIDEFKATQEAKNRKRPLQVRSPPPSIAS
jgi:hypothetical protein